MSYIRFDFTNLPKTRTRGRPKKDNPPHNGIRLYPLSCLHIGAEQSDVKFIKEHIQRIAVDPIARWVYMGDGGECVTKFSKGDPWTQVYPPQTQMDILVDLFKPIAGKGLFGIRGNHGNRIFKETGLSFDKNLCHRLGIPYMGVQAFANFKLVEISYDLFFHHGIDGGVSMQVKVGAAMKFNQFINVDAIVTSHSHIAMDLPPATLLSCDNPNSRVHTKLRHSYITGSGYDSRTGYAAEKGYPPLLPQFCAVEFFSQSKKQSFERWHSSGIHSVNGQFITDVNYDSIIEMERNQG